MCAVAVRKGKKAPSEGQEEPFCKHLPTYDHDTLVKTMTMHAARSNMNCSLRLEKNVTSILHD